MIATCRGLGFSRIPAALAALLAGCARANEPVVIGVAMGDGGQGAAIAMQVIDSTRGDGPAITIRETRGSSGVTGLPASVHVAEMLAADPNVIAVIGPNSSRDALLAAPMYNAGGIPHIVPTATSRRLRQAGAWTLLLAPDDSTEGAFAGRFIAERLHARRALILYVGDEYGSGLREGIEAALNERGVAIVDRLALEVSGRCPAGQPVNPNEDQIALVLRRAVPDVVVLASRAAEAGCATQAIHRRLPRMRYVAGDGVLPAVLAADAPAEALDSTYFVTFWFPDTLDARSRAFVRLFQEQFHRPPHYGDALVYDATLMVAEAVRAVGADRTRVRDYLHSLGRNRPAPPGLTGALSFTPSARTGIVVVRQRDGHIVAVTP